MRRVSQETFVVKYDGPALENGQMDVHELAPALLAIGDLCRSASSAANGDGGHVRVNVSSDFRTGSFDVSMVLDYGPIVAVAGLFIATQTDALGLLQLLFGENGLFAFLKFLNGEEPSERIEADGESIVVKNSPGANITIDKRVYNLSRDPVVRADAHRVVAPLHQEGIERFDVWKGNRVLTEVGKPQLPAFEPPLAPGEQLAVPYVHESTQEAILTVSRAVLEGDFKWTFSDGRRNFQAVMADEGFRRSVDERRFEFLAHDALKVRMRTLTRRTPTGRFINDYVVDEVIGKVAPDPTGGQQLQLLPVR